MKWLDGWNDRIILAIDHTKVDRYILNMPVLLVIDNTMIDFTKVQDNGEDIRIVPANHSKELPYEFDVFDKNNGIMKLWVLIESIPSNTPTFFFLYYNNPSATSGENSTQLWNACNCIMSLHFSELKGISYDSANDRLADGQNGSPTFVQDGSVGTSIVFNGSTDIYYNYLSSFNIHNYTIEVYFKRTGNPTHSGICGTRFGSDYTMDFKTENDCYYHYSIGTGSNWIHYADVGSNALPTNVWYHGVLRVGGGHINVFHEGNQIHDYSYSGSALLMKSNQKFHVGRSAGTEYGYYHMDEFRVYSERKSNEWIKVSRLSMLNQLVIYDQEVIKDMIPKAQMIEPVF